MATQPRTGFARRDGRRLPCPSGKLRYETDADALTALARVRRKRTVQTGEPRENHIYPCADCDGWHLSSRMSPHVDDLKPERERWDTETIEDYVRRLERRIAEQRGQILSLLAVGHGGNNKQARRRIEALTVALGRMTAMWHEERRHREALVEKLNERRRWLWGRA